MNDFFKSILKIFIRNELTSRREALKLKLNEQISRTHSQSVIIRNTAYLNMLDYLDGKGIDAIEKAIDKIKI